MMINYRKLKPRPHYVREELLFVNGGFTLKTHPMLSVHTTQAEEFTNTSIIGYLFVFTKSPRACGHTIEHSGPLLGIPTI